MQNHWILIGAGGHAAVAAEVIRLRGEEVVGYVAKEQSQHPAFRSITFLGDDDTFRANGYQHAKLVNGIGTTRATVYRKQVFEQYKLAGYSFPTLIHPSAYVSDSAVLDEGCLVMAGSVVQANVFIGPNSILNTSTTIEHDCVIGAHVHISSGAVLCGGVSVGEMTHVGARAVIRETLVIGRAVTIGLGAVVVHMVPDMLTVVGCPAKPMST